MWAWRSFLRRPNPLITIRLQPVRRHDAAHATVPCPNSRRRISSVAIDGDSQAGAPASATSDRLVSDPDRQLDRTADQQHQRTPAAKRHLYLVLDDHKHEYGIYKLDVDDAAADDDAGSDSARLLPHPAVIRVEVPAAIEQVAARFTALGSCIVTIGASPNTFGHHPEHCGVTYVYDTETSALSVACDGPKGLHYGYHDAVAVGGRLYAFESESEAYSWDRGTEPIRPYPGGMHCMSTDARNGDDNFRLVDDKTGNWWPSSWLPFSGSSRCFWSADPYPVPFFAEWITALAVHPSGRAIFASASPWSDDVRSFSYDTTSGQWAPMAGWRWQLPFLGHAGYDRELDAWVGLHVDDAARDETDGHLCACRVPSGDRPPERTVGGEKMLLEHPEWKHVDAKLVHMSERGEYCLVERLRRKGTVEEERLRDGDECLLRVIRFRVKYGEDGELITAMDRLYDRSYSVSRYRDDFEVAAFWI